MKKYTFRFHFRSWVDITVEADDRDDAEQLALDKYNNGEYEDDPTEFENTHTEFMGEEDIELKPAEFFSIYDGKVHISGYLWKYDEETWRLTEFTFCIIPIKEFIEEYAKRGPEFVDECEGDVQQYEENLTVAEALDVYRNYADSMKTLNYSEITEDTPVGNYRTN